jgi:hypothetical protein
VSTRWLEIRLLGVLTLTGLVGFGSSAVAYWSGVALLFLVLLHGLQHLARLPVTAP